MLGISRVTAFPRCATIACVDAWRHYYHMGVGPIEARKGTAGTWRRRADRRNSRIRTVDSWLIIAANAVVFYGACQRETFEIPGLKAALAGAANLLPVGFAIVVTTVANGLLTSHAHCVLWAFGTSLLHRPYPGRTALPNG